MKIFLKHNKIWASIKTMDAQIIGINVTWSSIQKLVEFRQNTQKISMKIFLKHSKI
jgi:hypothetical protein